MAAQKWEYTTVRVTWSMDHIEINGRADLGLPPTPQGLTDCLNRLGHRGWEVAGLAAHEVDHIVVILKRPLP